MMPYICVVCGKPVERDRFAEIVLHVDIDRDGTYTEVRMGYLVHEECLDPDLSAALRAQADAYIKNVRNLRSSEGMSKPSLTRA